MPGSFFCFLLMLQMKLFCLRPTVSVGCDLFLENPLLFPVVFYFSLHLTVLMYPQRARVGQAHWSISVFHIINQLLMHEQFCAGTVFVWFTSQAWNTEKPQDASGCSDGVSHQWVQTTPALTGCSTGNKTLCLNQAEYSALSQEPTCQV